LKLTSLHRGTKHRAASLRHQQSYVFVQVKGKSLCTLHCADGEVLLLVACVYNFVTLFASNITGQQLQLGRLKMEDQVSGVENTGP